MAHAIVARGGRPGLHSGRKPARAGPRRWRPGDAGVRKPPRMVHRRSRDHGRGVRYRARLHHQHRARPPAHPRQFGRARGDRFEREAVDAADPRDHALGACRTPDPDRRGAPVPGRAGRLPHVEPHDRRRCGGGARGGHRADRGLRARRYRVHHLHQRHRRRAARGAAAPRRDPVQRGGCRRGSRRGFRAQRRRALPLVPAAQPRLRTHRRPVPADRVRRGNLLFRRAREARRQYRGNPADGDGGGPAAVRSAARADHEDGREAGQGAQLPDEPRAGDRRATPHAACATGPRTW